MGYLERQKQKLERHKREIERHKRDIEALKSVGFTDDEILKMERIAKLDSQILTLRGKWFVRLDSLSVMWEMLDLINGLYDVPYFDHAAYQAERFGYKLGCNEGYPKNQQPLG